MLICTNQAVERGCKLENPPRNNVHAQYMLLNGAIYKLYMTYRKLTILNKPQRDLLVAALKPFLQ